jgi:uncharacterized protein
MTRHPRIPAAVAAKLDALRRRLAGLQRAVVAYSGGIDSTFLLAVADEVLGEGALGVTAVSPSLSAHEKDAALQQAAELNLGPRHVLVETAELQDEAYRANDAKRCYHCRSAMMEALQREAAARGIEAILLGAIADDLDDYRPGEAAAAESGALFPLREAGLSKDEIRLLARARGLSGWDRPAAACLASRLAYGLEVTPERLAMVEQAEALLREWGYAQVRVRHHGQLARIELPPAQLGAFVDAHAAAAGEALRGLGFTWVALDVEGYRRGSFNAMLGDAMEV